MKGKIAMNNHNNLLSFIYVTNCSSSLGTTISRLSPDLFGRLWTLAMQLLNTTYLSTEIGPNQHQQGITRIFIMALVWKSYFWKKHVIPFYQSHNLHCLLQYHINRINVKLFGNILKRYNEKLLLISFSWWIYQIQKDTWWKADQLY